MKGKILLFFIGTMLLMMFYGCSKNIVKDNGSITGASTTLPAQNQSPEDAAGSIEGDSSGNTGQENDASIGRNNKDYGSIGFELMDNESIGFLKRNIPDKDVTKDLGEGEAKSNAIEWGADGMEHQTWYYRTKGIELDMIRLESSNQVVNTVKISSPCNYKTKRGIGIGSTKEEVLNAYKDEINPEESAKDSSVLVAGSIYGGIVFRLENNQVSSIFIGAAAE